MIGLEHSVDQQHRHQQPVHIRQTSHIIGLYHLLITYLSVSYTVPHHFDHTEYCFTYTQNMLYEMMLFINENRTKQSYYAIGCYSITTATVVQVVGQSYEASSSLSNGGLPPNRFGTWDVFFLPKHGLSWSKRKRKDVLESDPRAYLCY